MPSTQRYTSWIQTLPNDILVIIFRSLLVPDRPLIESLRSIRITCRKFRFVFDSDPETSSLFCRLKQNLSLLARCNLCIVLASMKSVDQMWDVCYQALQMDPSSLSWIHNQTPDLIRMALDSSKGKALSYVREPSHGLCLEVVSKWPNCLERVPPHLRTPEMCMIAVNLSGLDLQYVPEEVGTLEIRLSAVMQGAYKQPPSKSRNKRIDLVTKLDDGGFFFDSDTPPPVVTPLAFVPVKHQTPELCLAAVRRNPKALYDVKNQTIDVCLAAVEISGLTLQFVRGSQPFEVCVAALKQNPQAHRYVRCPSPALFAAVQAH